MIDRWQRGESILIRFVWRNQVWYAEPVTVVSDTSERLIVFLQSGTPVKWTRVDFATGAFIGPYDHKWHSTDVLIIVEEGASHAVWAMWEAGGGPFKGWYVNLQDKLRRVPGGVVTWDRSLDIIVTPDLDWKWKDEDHFKYIQELGWITSEEATAWRSEGERVIERIERRDRPFCEPWPQWRPDKEWQVPALPNNWAQVTQVR